MTREDTPMSAERFGNLLQDVLRGLPVKAQPFVKGLAFVIEDRPADGRKRVSDWTGRAFPKFYSQYWARPANLAEPLGKVILYREPILGLGLNTEQVLRDIVLRSIEGKLGVDSGDLERDIVEEGAESGDPVEGPAEPEPGDELIDLAEREIKLLGPSGHRWFAGVEVIAVDSPESEGDPFRLADFPKHDDDPRTLILYTLNILKKPESRDLVVKGIVREAARRAGIH